MDRPHLLDTDRRRRRLPRALGKTWIAVACLLAASLPGTASAGEISTDLAAALDRAPAEREIAVIATFDDDVDPGAYAGRRAALIRAMRRAARSSQDRVLEDSGAVVDERFWLVNAAALRATPEEIRALADDPDIDVVDVDRPVTVNEISSGAWGTALSSPGSGNWGVGAVRANEVWSAHGLTGDGVRVGNIDTGVTADNPALAGKVVAWRDFVNGATLPYDDHGHGTHTLGTVLGGGTSGAPIGVAPNARAVVAKAMDSRGAGSASSLLAAAQWMTDPDGNPATADHPAVVNNSWSAQDANDPWFRDMVRSWISLGIVPVFAGGNFGPGAQTIGSPAGYPESIAVGALTPSGQAADFSSRGPVNWSDADGLGPAAGTLLTKPDVSAPGASILSAYDTGYAYQNGTSMAAPHIAGIAALVKQINPEADPAALHQILRETASDLGAPGPDQTYGAGRVDAMAVVERFTAGAAPRANVVFATTPPEHYRGRVATYGVRMTNATHFVWRVDEGAWSAPSADSRFSVRLDPGPHTVEIMAVATEGVAADLSPARHTITVDRGKPKGVIAWTARAGTVRLTANVIDDVSGVAPEAIAWSLGNGRTVRGAEIVHRYISQRPRRIRVAITDRAGNRRVLRRWVRPRARTVRALRGKRAVRQAAPRLKISFASTRPGRVKVSLRPVRTIRGAFATNRTSDGVSLSGVPAVLKVVSRPVSQRVIRVKRGRGLTTLRLRRPAPGVYRVTARLIGKAGRGERAVTRTVRIRP